jgi:hypothetical protein
MKKIMILLLIMFFANFINAQTFLGKVIDSLTHKPLRLHRDKSMSDLIE